MGCANLDRDATREKAIASAIVACADILKNAGVPNHVIADHFLTFGMGLSRAVNGAVATAARLEDLKNLVRDQAS